MYGVSVNMLAAIVVLSLAVVHECVSALHMYPEIFDPSKFLARPLPLKSARPSAAGDHHLARGFQDDETGFVRSSSESGKTGFVHRENFHRKDGNKYGSEKQTGHGESRRSEEPTTGALKNVLGGVETGRRIIETDHYRPEPMYEVNEEQTSDYENPDKHKKYGTTVKPVSEQEEANMMKKKKQADKQMKTAELSLKDATGARKPRKGGRSNQQNNHNGYESIVYHENEHDSMEQGYGKRKAVGKLPAKQLAGDNPSPAQGRLLEDDNEEYEEDRHGDDEVEDDETRHDHGGNDDDDDDEGDDSEDTGERGNDSDFGDNYDAVRFDSDFERSFGNGAHDEASFEEHNEGRKGVRKGKGRQHDNADYDYDEEVDREQVDESASEDKYRGDDESDEEEEEHEKKDAERDDDDDGRQYEYASEADSDAQDY
ncbi:glutamic acid-rich protein-like [Anopheles albimanus]|uniref:glutamic acid-rich protein-like n=1 Tax=Anopheles albimanus TaxID=7167 RepID=UPI00163EBDCB|nr:glutamic acid-rich protein-like [Anopheles albimanus]